MTTRTTLLLLLWMAACGGDGRRLEPTAPREQGEIPAPADEQTASAEDPPEGDAPAGPMGEILAAHNRLRADHCAPPLTWSDELQETAQGWADTMARHCTLEHSDHPHGENLYMGSIGVRTPAGVAEQWHSEVSDYDFRRGGFSMQTGHFTQLVWSGTRALGCGQSTCNGLAVWVCMYDPPGNVQGGYRDNVRPTSCR